MVKDENTVWLGLEYFCSEGDGLWIKSDGDLARLVVDELVKIGFIETDDVIDSYVLRMQKVYPAYYGTYKDIAVIRKFMGGR